MAMTVSGPFLKRAAALLWTRLPQQSASAAAAASSGALSTFSSERILEKKLDGKVAIVTGGSGAIGSAVCKLFAAHGAKVIVADIDNENGCRLSSEIGPSAVYRHCDVGKEQDVASTVDFAVEKFGKLDIMYNNAATASPLQNLQSMDMDAYDRCTTVMVRGVVLGIKHAARVMISAKRGIILTTASTAAVTTSMSMPLIYNINKQNLPGITKIAANHLGKYGIRVNCISPHGIPNKLVVSWLECLGWETDIAKVKQAFQKASPLVDKACSEEDIAKAALFLCSDDSGYVSGQNLVVDGGYCNAVDYDPFQMGRHEKL